MRTGIGEVVGFPTTGVGNPQSCCQMSGGDGIGVRYGPHDDIGMFYSMCNPSMGCKGAAPYTCTTCEPPSCAPACAATPLTRCARR